MYITLRLSLLYSTLACVCLFFTSPSFSSHSLFEQFTQSQQWDEKKQLSIKLLAAPNITSDEKLEVYLQLADFALEKDNFSAAVEHYQLAATSTSFEEHPQRYFQALKMQGVTYYYQGLMQQAVSAYMRALSVARNMEQPISEANLLSNIGLAYFNMINMEQHKIKRIFCTI